MAANLLHVCLWLSLWILSCRWHCGGRPADLPLLCHLWIWAVLFGIGHSDLLSFSFLPLHLLVHSLPDKIKLIFILKLYLTLFTLASNSKPIIPQTAYIQGTLLNFQGTVMVFFEKAERNFLTTFLHIELALLPSLQTHNLSLDLLQSLLSAYFRAGNSITKNSLRARGPGKLEK